MSKKAVRNKTIGMDQRASAHWRAEVGIIGICVKLSGRDNVERRRKKHLRKASEANALDGGINPFILWAVIAIYTRGFFLPYRQHGLTETSPEDLVENPGDRHAYPIPQGDL